MVLSIGADFVKVDRIKDFITRNSTDAIEHIFKPSEYVGKGYNTIAGKYAAKEALLKALGIGFSLGVKRLSEIEVSNSANGSPNFITHGIIDQIINDRKICKIHISISHDAGFALAFVVLNQ